MSAENIIALMLTAFAAYATLGLVVIAFWLIGNVYTAALVVITYIVSYLEGVQDAA